MTTTSRERARTLIAAWRKQGVRVGDMEADSLALAFDDVRRRDAVYHWLSGFAVGVVFVIVVVAIVWLIKTWRLA